jgi:VanZ family protein
LKLRRWLPPLLWAGVILLGTSLPSDAVPIQTSRIDKILHFTIYTVFAFLLTQQLSEGFRLWQAVVLAIAFAMAFGAFDEWHQQLIPGRFPEFADWVADCLGSIIGASAAALLLHRRQLSRRTLDTT